MSRVSVDLKTIGGAAVGGMLVGGVAGAKKGCHMGVVYGRRSGGKGTVLMSALGACGGFIVGAVAGGAASVKKAFI